MTAARAVAYQIADDEENLSLPPESLPTGAGLPVSGPSIEEDVYRPPQRGPEPRCGRPFFISLAVIIALIVAASATAGLVVSRRSKSTEGSDAPDAPPQRNATMDAEGSTTAPSTGPVGKGGKYTLAPIPDGPVSSFDVSVVKATPHDTAAFLQGFEYDASRGVFFESTGIYGRSSLRRVEINSGKVLQIANLADKNVFGEGMTLHGADHIYMLTWKAQKGYVFNQSSFDILREWEYKGEGWGLASDRVADVIYMTDGTASVRVLDPETLEIKRRFSVTMDGKSVVKLNEVEWVCGELWANVWMTNYIVRIDPKTGKVWSRISVGKLPRSQDLVPGKTYDVLNGIAFDELKRRIWITGKLWPAVYEVSINDPAFAEQCGT